MNIPPMPNGLLHENDVNRLREFGEWKQEAFSCNLAKTADVFSKDENPDHPVCNLLEDTSNTWYQPKEGKILTELIFSLPEVRRVGYLVLKEAIQYSQRVEAFQVSVKTDENVDWEKIYEDRGQAD